MSTNLGAVQYCSTAGLLFCGDQCLPALQQRRPPPVAETGRSCWGRGQQDASGSEADAGSRNPGSVCEAGKPVSKEHLHSDKHWLLIESSYRCVFVLSQHPCPLRRSRASSPRGRALEVRESVISITKKAPGTMRNVNRSVKSRQ